MKIKFQGKEREITPDIRTAADLLAAQKWNPKQCIVMLNSKLLPAPDEYTLCDGDQIDVVVFAAGG